MVVELKPVEVEMEPLVARVFLKAVDLLGGLKKLAEYRTLTWLPSLARASFVVVLREEYLRSEEEIAREIGLSKQTVRNMLRANPELALSKIENIEGLSQEERKGLRVHTAGGIAKIAYKMVKEGDEGGDLFLDYCIRTAESLDIPWAYLVLRRLKGVKFPLKSPKDLSDRVKGVVIKGREAEEVLGELEYPIRTPAQLLHLIKENLKMHGID